MSVLSLPRIHFKGFTLWSPSTANNHNNVYDEANVAPIRQPGWTYADFVTKLKSENPDWCEPWGSWNLYGDHGVTFQNASVSGIQLAGGDVNCTDPLCGCAVNIYGMSWVGGSPPARLVMTDPFSWGSETSQIFYQSIVVGDSNVGFSAKGGLPFFSKLSFRPRPTNTPAEGCPPPASPARNLNFSKTLIFEGTESCCWWAGLAKDKIQWFGLNRSPALAKLKATAEAGGNQGIVFRFVSYCTQYYTTNPTITNGLDLVKAYQSGFTGDNPARSSMLGTIGVWEQGELSSAPTDLPLSPDAAATMAGSPPVFLGPAMAKIDTVRKVVVLDMVNAIPEIDESLAKANLGTLALYAGASPVGSLAYSSYARSAYEATGGICEIPIPTGVDIGKSPLTLVHNRAGGPVLLRQAGLLAETDQWAVYVDQGQTAMVTVTVMQNGKPAPPGTMLLLAQYNSRTGDAMFNPAPNHPDSPILALVDEHGVPLRPPVTVPVKQGKAVFGVRPIHPGACVVGFFPYLGAAPKLPAGDFPVPDYRYTCVRALPFDNELEANTPDSALTWPFIYTNVLRTFDLMYPVMSLVRNLASLPVVEGMADQLKAAIDVSLTGSTLYMPITRDLSAGKRALLQRFINLMPNIPSDPPGSV